MDRWTRRYSCSKHCRLQDSFSYSVETGRGALRKDCQALVRPFAKLYVVNNHHRSFLYICLNHNGELIGGCRVARHPKPC